MRLARDSIIMFAKLVPFRAIPSVRKLSTVAAVVLCLGFSGNALAQNIQPRPVARLLSASGNNPNYSRPRRVTSSDTLPTSSIRSNNEAGSEAMKAEAVSSAFANATEIEKRAFEKTNVARAENGLPPLVWDAELCRMARAHSERMATLGFFSHETPEGLQLKDRAHETGILHFRVIAENIAYNKGYDDPGEFAVDRWMISSGHRANILYVGFQASAIGSYVTADGSTYLTQVFIAR
jgi:uncharacterized protein YkwD